MSAKNSMKLLVPLATIAVGAAVTVGSGATWTSTTTNKATISGGTLVHTNDHHDATLAISHLKPGMDAVGEVTLREGTASDLDSKLTMVWSNVSSSFLRADDLKITVTRGGYTGNSADTATSGEIQFSSLHDPATNTIDLGTLPDGWDATTITITVSIPEGVGNDEQGKTAGGDIQFITTQTDATESTGTGVTWSDAAAG